MLISDKIKFRTKCITGDQEDWQLIKCLIQQNGITILNRCAPKKRASKFMTQKQLNLKGKKKQIQNYSWKSQHSSILLFSN